MLIDRGGNKSDQSTKYFYIMRKMIMLERNAGSSQRNLSNHDNDSMKAYEKVTVCGN